MGRAVAISLFTKEIATETDKNTASDHKGNGKKVSHHPNFLVLHPR